jgi:hypothetical protein
MPNGRVGRSSRSGSGSSAARGVPYWRKLNATAHSEMTRRERHLRSAWIFQRDRLSPSDAGSSVGQCPERTVDIKHGAKHAHMSTRLPPTLEACGRSGAGIGRKVQNGRWSRRVWLVALEVPIQRTRWMARSCSVFADRCGKVSGAAAWTSLDRTERFGLDGHRACGV